MKLLTPTRAVDTLLGDEEQTGKGRESEQFRMDSGVRQGCIISPWLFNVYMDGVMKEVKMGMGRRGVSFLEDRREWRLPGICMQMTWFIWRFGGGPEGDGGTVC